MTLKDKTNNCSVIGCFNQCGEHRCSEHQEEDRERLIKFKDRKFAEAVKKLKYKFLLKCSKAKDYLKLEIIIKEVFGDFDDHSSQINKHKNVLSSEDKESEDDSNSRLFCDSSGSPNIDIQWGLDNTRGSKKGCGKSNIKYYCGIEYDCGSYCNGELVLCYPKCQGDDSVPEKQVQKDDVCECGHPGSMHGDNEYTHTGECYFQLNSEKKDAMKMGFCGCRKFKSMKGDGK